MRLYELQLLAHVPGLACQHKVHVAGAGVARVNGEYYDLALYSMLASEWREG